MVTDTPTRAATSPCHCPLATAIIPPLAIIAAMALKIKKVVAEALIVLFDSSVKPLISNYIPARMAQDNPRIASTLVTTE